MATDKPITGFSPLDIGDVQSDDILVVVDVHDTSQSSSGSTKTLTLAALLGSIVDLTMSGVLTLTSALSKIVPGATSFSIRNHADSADNLLVADDGTVTAREAVRGAQLTGLSVAPTVAVGSAAGVGATVTITGSNTAGVVDVLTGGSGTTNGTIATITFSAPLTGTPVGIAIYGLGGGPTQYPTLYTTTTTTTLQIGANPDDTLNTATHYLFNYQVIGYGN